MKFSRRFYKRPNEIKTTHIISIFRNWEPDWYLFSDSFMLQFQVIRWHIKTFLIKKFETTAEWQWTLEITFLYIPKAWIWGQQEVNYGSVWYFSLVTVWGKKTNKKLSLAIVHNNYRPRSLTNSNPYIKRLLLRQKGEDTRTRAHTPTHPHTHTHTPSLA